MSESTEIVSRARAGEPRGDSLALGDVRDIRDIIAAGDEIEPWTEGENIPWGDPEFSRRMLAEHLSQSHALASRRDEVINAQVRWIHQELAGVAPMRVLDLGCGPGLYAERLARLGHSVVGVDLAPAAIEYARERAATEALDCEYLHGDMIEVGFPGEFTLAMFLYGELNSFPPTKFETLLASAIAALEPGGALMLEFLREEIVEGFGKRPSSWRAREQGLFSDRPHLELIQSHWAAEQRAASRRYIIIDAETGDVTRHAQTHQAWSDQEIAAKIEAVGFTDVRFEDGLGGSTDDDREAMQVVLARKRGSNQ